MERYKLPAGQLATIFYKADPRTVASIASSSNSSDTETGDLDPDVPPLTSGDTTPVEHVSSHNGRILSWSNITLEHKVDGQVKRLLNNLSGMLRCSSAGLIDLRTNSPQAWQSLDN